MKDTWVSPSANTEQDNLLAWNQWRYQKNGWSMPNMPTSLPTGNQDSYSTQPQHRTPMAIPGCWFLYIWWIWVLSHHQLLHQNAIHQEDTTIVMLPKQLHCSRRCSLSMEFLKLSDLTMAHNLPAINLPSLLRSGTLITPLAPLGMQGVMAKLKLLSKLQKVSSPMLSIQGRTPTLALLVYRSTPIDAHLCSPAEMLYQRAIQTTVSQRIRHKDPQAAADQDHLNDCVSQSAAYHDRHCKQKSPTLCRTNCLHTKWCQDPLAPSHSHPSSPAWLTLGWSHWRRIVQMCSLSHSWTSPRCCQTQQIYHCWCSSSYTWVLTWNASSETSTSSPSHCTVAQATTPPILVAPATTPHTPRKSVVHTPQQTQTPSTGDVPRLVAAPAPICWSTSQEAPNQLLEEMWPRTTPEDVPDIMLTQTAPGWWTFNIMADEH